MSARGTISSAAFNWTWVLSALILAAALCFATATSISRAEAEATVESLERELAAAEQAQAAEVQAEQRAAAHAERLLVAEQQRFAQQGWTPTEVEGLYYQWSTADYTCGYWPCAALAMVTTESSCLNGAYVEANIVVDGVIAGFTNELIASLPPEQPAAILLENHTGFDGGTFELTRFSCS